jgi:hypothetical protein
MIRFFWGSLSLIILTTYAIYLGVFGDSGPPKILTNIKSYAQAGFSHTQKKPSAANPGDASVPPTK